MFKQEELKNLQIKYRNNIKTWRLVLKKCKFCWLEAYYKKGKKPKSPFECHWCLAINK